VQVLQPLVLLEGSREGRTHMMDADPVFGQRAAGAAYVLRPSAYALIKNAVGQVAIVRTAQGVFLPGGGIERGETPEQAVQREALEECGFDIRLLSLLPGAVQLLYSPSELTYFEIVSTFFRAVVERSGSGPTESGHELLWAVPGDAESLLSHESHRWALRSSHD